MSAKSQWLLLISIKIDGRVNKCKECTKASVKKNRKANHDYYKEYDKSRYNNDPIRRALQQKQRVEWVENNRARANELKRNWAKKNKHKTRAHLAVHRAVKSGELKREPCERCSREPSQAHHEDYSRPLDVVWLCSQCHSDEHVKQRERKTNE